MEPFRKFKIIPDIPEPLQALSELAFNLWFTWNPEAIKLFIQMDSDLWEATSHNPVRMLGEINQDRLEELAHDEGFIMELERVAEQLHQYVHNQKSVNDSRGCAVAYFSAEYGLTDTLPIYSGGLGILSGDHVKSASDLNLNFRGVGMLYQLGYFQQYLNQDGWQQDFYQTNDFHNMQVSEVRENDLPVEIELALPGRHVFLKAWEIRVGRVSLYMLDANTERNSEEDRRLTAQLYGGNRETRLQQEIILGIGGLRLLDRLGIQVDVIHMNEGHSAFTTFERARLLMKKKGLTFAEAIVAAKKSSVFTTHTSVPAGLDEFVPDLMTKYFTEYVRELGITMDQFLAYGRFNPTAGQENFSMTVAAMRNSTYINGVSSLHADVSRKMWRGLWKETPEEHIPIHGITNGIHIPTWISFEMNDLYERYLGSKWREKQDYPDAWEKVLNIPDPELWNVHEIRRRRLVSFTRQRLKRQLAARGASNQLINDSQEVLNPQALTIGFARRFATYKRGTLIFRDPERLISLLNNPDRPVQIIFAGKAHPQDQYGKEFIKNIIHFIQTHHLRRKIVFIEDYDINVARYLVQGVDIWLNNPLRPLEACGTSGMKAACNGVLNFSVLDGWWDEAYDLQNGWAIGNREAYQDQEYQNEVESKAIYSILENDIVPRFYERGSDGLPRDWIKMMKRSLLSIASFYNTHRMVKEYYTRFYKSAKRNAMALQEHEYTPLREFVLWKERIKSQFHDIRIENVSYNASRLYKIREKMDVSAQVKLGSIQPDEVRVDVYSGQLQADGMVRNSSIEPLTEVEALPGGTYRFSGILPLEGTGQYGFRIRITPAHPLINDPYELNLVLWG